MQAGRGSLSETRTNHLLGIWAEEGLVGGEGHTSSHGSRHDGHDRVAGGIGQPGLLEVGAASVCAMRSRGEAPDGTAHTPQEECQTVAEGTAIHIYYAGK